MPPKNELFFFMLLTTHQVLQKRRMTQIQGEWPLAQTVYGIEAEPFY
jgi:hypothetical protein